MKIYDSKNFSAKCSFAENKLIIKQQVKNDIVNTNMLPNTLKLLKKFLPTIFDNECINYDNKSFKEEAKSTEIGHLFEHIFIELLKLEGEKNFEKPDIKATTSWDWNSQPFGSFEIEINYNTNTDRVFTCFNKSGVLLDLIYDN